MNRFLFRSIFILLLVSLVAAPVVLAQGIVPSPGGKDAQSCEDLSSGNIFKSNKAFRDEVGGDRAKLRNALGCAVKTGDLRLYMLPFFVTYLVQFLLQIAGVVALLFIVLGGYYYVIGGLTEDKEKGKKTLTHAIAGLIVALSAWIIVNFIQVALTS